jgi:uncharacterized oligopeptide transporter (OPT) family protein
VVAFGCLLFLLGSARFFLRHQFGFREALYCCSAVIPAGLLLLVLDYTLHHAKLVVVIPVLAAGMLAFSSPVFDVALGLAMMAVVAGPALSEKGGAKRQRGSGTSATNKSA